MIDLIEFIMISQKAQYALRAIFELSKRYEQNEWVKISDIANAQAIPVRFLEVILNELRHGGFVESRRGIDGGYKLLREPVTISVGDILRFLEPFDPVDCIVSRDGPKCKLYGKCVFLALWKKVHETLSKVYDETNFQNLVNEQKLQNNQDVICYYI